MRRIGQLVFVGAVAVALVLYWVTAPEGLPWNGSTHLALAYLGEIVRLPTMPHPIWGCYVQVFGGAVAVSVVMAALAAGLLAVLVNRYFGWRFAASAALVWIFLPGVWDRAITGERVICLAAMAVVAAWAVNWVAVQLWRKLCAMLAAKHARGTLAVGALPSAHVVSEKRGKVNRIAGWVVMGAAGLFAVVSLTLHDYRLGEAAGAFARGVVEEAGERVIVLNGVCDDQVVREVGKRKSNVLCTLSLRNDDAYRTNLVAWVRSAFPAETNLLVAAQVGPSAFVEEALRRHPDRFYLMGGTSAALDAWERRWEAFKPYLGSSDPFVRTARRMFGYEGNGIANALMDEKVNLEGQGQRRNLSSCAAVPLTSGEDAPRIAPPSELASLGGYASPLGGRRSGEATSSSLVQNESGAKRHVHSSPSPNLFDSSQTAWRLYKRIYTEIDPGNFSALVNMSEMIRRGHAAGGEEKKKVQEALEKFFKDAFNRQHAREIVRASGPIRADPAIVEKMAAEAKKRIAAKVAAGEKVEYSPEILSLVEWNNEMVRLMAKGEIVQAGRLARAILSNPKWKGFVPANAVMGSVAAKEGDYVSSAAFFKVATDTTNDVPAAVLNDYADTLMHLGDLDEAERQARRAVKATDEAFWIARLTLAEVLERKEKVKVRGEGEERKVDEAALAAFAVGAGRESKCEDEVEERNLTTGAASPLNGADGVRALPAGRRSGEATSPSLLQKESGAKRHVHSSPSPSHFDSSQDEIRALLKSVFSHAPAKTCDRIRREHKEVLQ